MTVLSGLAAGVGGTLFNAAVFLFVLSVVVFVHELGHFLVARWCGVRVAAFSIGFGRELFGFDDRHGTRWRFAAIPLGGYVKFMDDENIASTPTGEAPRELTPEELAGSFHHKPLWQKAAVVAAGPIANFLFAIIVFAIMFMTLGIRSTAPKVDEVVPGMPAAKAGIQAGDVIKAINGKKTRDFRDVQRIVFGSVERELLVTVVRDGRDIQLKMTPELRAVKDPISGTDVKQPQIGIKRAATAHSYETKQPGPLEAVWLGAKETEYVISTTLNYIGDIFMMRQDASQLGGILRVAETTRQVVKHNPEWLPNLIAYLSVSIGLINLFPIPILDGGHLMFYAIEAVRRRPLSERTQEIAFRVGLAMVLMLMAFAFWNDKMIPGRWFGLAG